MTTKTGKHTEGPWNYEKDDVDETFFITNNSIQPFGEDIAYKIKKESNAHLIASAPDMKRCIEQLLANCMPNEGKDAVIDYAIEVLKRAEGRV